MLDSLVLLSLFIYGYSVLYFLKTSKQNYIQNYKKVTLGFLGSSVLTLSIYEQYYKVYFSNFPYKTFLLLIPFFLLLFVLFFTVQKKLKRSTVSFFEKRNMYFVSFDIRFIFSMSMNILGQQLGLLLIFLVLQDMGIPLLWFLLLFSLLFTLSHIYVMSKNLYITSYFFLCTFFAGLLYPIAILTVPGGIIYAYMFHWLFYVATGLLFYVLKNNNLKLLT